MEDYRSKLRSAKKRIKEEVITNKNDDESSLSYPESPKTPPRRGIEFYFPPSPYGRTRHQSYGDRLIPERDRNPPITNDTLSSTRQHDDPKPNIMPVETITEYFVGEVLPSMNADTLNTPSRGHRMTSDHNNSDSSTSRVPLHSSRHFSINNAHYRRSSYSDIAVSLYRQPTNNHHSTSALSSSSSSSLISPLRHSVQYDPNSYSPNAPQFQTSIITEVGRRILTSFDTTSQPIKAVPLKTLDAPGIVADFYYHLIDWGSNNCVAVALGSAVYLWNANTSAVSKLCDFVSHIVTTVKWSTIGSLLLVGLKSGKMILFDTTTHTRLRDWWTHLGSYSISATWKSNILTSGSRNYIYHHDVRSPNEYFRKLEGHTQQVIGLRWNPEGTLLASGSSDNRLLVWNSHENEIVHSFNEHTAAVRGVAWSPHKRGILASGGGTEDRTIKLWNTMTGRMTGSYDTGSQVCNLEWSEKSDHIVSSHGFAPEIHHKPNQLVIWKASNMKKVASFEAHTTRVVYMAMSNDASTVVTGAGDEELRFWDLFSNSPTMKIDLDGGKPCVR